MINEWVAFLDTLDNPQGAHEGLAHTLELIEMRWCHSIKICSFFHIVVMRGGSLALLQAIARITIHMNTLEKRMSPPACGVYGPWPHWPKELDGMVLGTAAVPTLRLVPQMNSK